MKELKVAILELQEGRTYNSPRIERALRNENFLSLRDVAYGDFEINLLNSIANGLTQDEIQEFFKSKNISPNSKSSIEKRLKELRKEFQAKTNPHLVGIAKDLKLI